MRGLPSLDWGQSLAGVGSVSGPGTSHPEPQSSWIGSARGGGKTQWVGQPPPPQLGGTPIAACWYGDRRRPPVVWGSPHPTLGGTPIATCWDGGRGGQGSTFGLHVLWDVNGAARG